MCVCPLRPARPVGQRERERARGSEREREGEGEGASERERERMLPIVLERLKERLTRTPARTHNRIRSPRRAASGPWNKVGKGRRQNRPVTLGKD